MPFVIFSVIKSGPFEVKDNQNFDRSRFEVEEDYLFMLLAASDDQLNIEALQEFLSREWCVNF